MKTQHTYTVEHLTKGIIAKGLSFSELRKKAFNIRSKQNFSFVADADYIVINEVTGEKLPMQHIPN
jgi:hypothetical protein